MKFLIATIGLFLSTVCSAQVDTIDTKLFQFEFDSCVVSIWDIYFKESSTSEVGGTFNEITSPNKELFHKQLTKEEGYEWLSILSEVTSYDDERSLLNHFNLVIEYYQRGKVISSTEISTMTGNFTSQNFLNDLYYRNSCSLILGSQIESLLLETGAVKELKLDEVDLEGLRPVSN